MLPHCSCLTPIYEVCSAGSPTAQGTLLHIGKFFWGTLSTASNPSLAWTNKWDLWIRGICVICHGCILLALFLLKFPPKMGVLYPSLAEYVLCNQTKTRLWQTKLTRKKIIGKIWIKVSWWVDMTHLSKARRGLTQKCKILWRSFPCP